MQIPAFSREAMRGQVLPMAAICLTLLMGIAAIAVDTGYMRYSQRVQQSAADAAAVAGAAELAYPSPDVAAAAQVAATNNGYTGGGNVSVNVYNPPVDGAYDGDNAAVEVQVQVANPSFFSKIWGNGNDAVTSEAVAVLNPHGGNDCIYVLDPSSTTIFNGATVDAPNCGLIANGALTVNGATMDMLSIGAAGKIISNGATYKEATPAAAVQAADPCPMISACSYLTQNPPATKPCTYNSYLTNGGSSATLSPGIYCGTTIFNGTTTVNFNPGTYVFTGQVISNGVSNFKGSDVTFIVSGNNTVTFNGSEATLSPPTTGNTAGILFYAPDATSATLNGGTGDISGAIYFPKADLTFNGDSSSYYALITYKLTQNGAISMAGKNLGGSSIGKAVLAQ